MFEVTEIYHVVDRCTDTCDVCGSTLILDVLVTLVVAEDDQGFTRSACLCNYCGDTVHINTEFDSFGEFLEFIELRREELKPWIKVDLEE